MGAWTGSADSSCWIYKNNWIYMLPQLSSLIIEWDKCRWANLIQGRLETFNWINNRKKWASPKIYELRNLEWLLSQNKKSQATPCIFGWYLGCTWTPVANVFPKYGKTAEDPNCTKLIKLNYKITEVESYKVHMRGLITSNFLRPSVSVFDTCVGPYLVRTSFFRLKCPDCSY